MPDSTSYEVHPYPLERRIIADTVRLARRKNTMQGLFEVNVTQARQAIRAYRKRTGEGLSFTAFVISCLGKAVEQHREVQGVLNAWNRVVVFDDVDIATMIEVDYEGQKFPLTHVIRAANRRSLSEIHNEIRGIQADPEALLHAANTPFMRYFLLLPAFLRDVFYRVLLSSPKLMKRTIGTVQLSTVGMFGRGGWVISPPIYNLCLMLGGVAEKPVVVGGEVVSQQMMSVTLYLNHDIVDGAPAARFTHRLVEMIESGYGLEEGEIAE
ncbi:MAG: 2-oxo acid dehydrogenase subunit E2 [Anaerolineae bacterium]|nr:2-oxo acid dehydrogenase subunit E2 [Anaerolineae bacterium]